MRADRLISLLMLLQSRGKMKASQLADILEVSERTVYRDIDALSATGVPVYAEPGPQGGYALLGAYQTRLTGMTDEELRVLFMLSIPQPLVELGLGTDLKQALLKLSAALPNTRRLLEDQFRQRFHLDSTAWEQRLEPVPYLQQVYQAVRLDRRLSIRYQPIYNVKYERWVEPFGLVAKGGAWYLVCSSQAKLSVLRVVDLSDVRIGEETFTRPADFDLQVFWQSWCEQQALTRQGYRVTVRIFPRLLPFLPQVFGAFKPEQTCHAAGNGELQLDLFFESLESARSQLLALGSGVEVLAPRSLRCSMRDYAEQILGVYSNQ
jgi:predicted DNA-binding transcriptional regulator YafY